MQEVAEYITEAIDNIEVFISKLDPIELPVVHTFSPGMYMRQIFMPKNSLITSKIHRTKHTYRVSKGRLKVYNAEQDSIIGIKAPYDGVTYPGTRRVLYIERDTVWTTYHMLDFITGEENNYSEEKKMEFIEYIESILLEPHENKLLKEDIKWHSQLLAEG